MHALVNCTNVGIKSSDIVKFDFEVAIVLLWGVYSTAEIIL